MKFCRIMHWSTGNVFRSVSTFWGANSTSWEAYTDFILLCDLLNGKEIDGMTGNFVGWALGMFSKLSQLSEAPTQLPGKHTRIFPSLRPIVWQGNGRNDRKFCRMSTGNVFRTVSTFWGANSTSWEAYTDLSFFATYWMARKWTEWQEIL